MDGRRNNGGRRSGAGRRPTDTEWFWGRMSRETRVQLNRYAQQMGIRREERRTFWEKIFKSLLSKVDIQEPDYVLLAKSITIRDISEHRG